MSLNLSGSGSGCGSGLAVSAKETKIMNSEYQQKAKTPKCIMRPHMVGVNISFLFWNFTKTKYNNMCIKKKKTTIENNNEDDFHIIYNMCRRCRRWWRRRRRVIRSSVVFFSGSSDKMIYWNVRMCKIIRLLSLLIKYDMNGGETSLCLSCRSA